MNNKITLYSYYRSSCSYRVRIALYLKNIPFEYQSVHLLKKENKKNSYKAINPQGLVPALLHNKHTITQSMAILHYLEDLYPSPNLFPKDPLKKSQVLSICEVINSNIQPLQNLQVLNYFHSYWQISKRDKIKWIHKWLYKGLLSVEKKIEKKGPFALGRSLTVADLFIVPQIYNARRFNMNLKNFPHLLAIDNICQHISAFKKAHPSCQPDSAY